MDPAFETALIIGVVELLAAPVIVFMIKRAISKRLDSFDAKRDEARVALADAERMAREQRNAERTIVLAIARTMLLDNYEKCMEKGYYTVEEREVYSKLKAAYADDGGNGVIDALAPRIRALPTEPPEHDKHYHQDF